MEVDPVLLAVVDDRPDVHRPGRRPRIRAGLRPEPEPEQGLGDRRNVGRVRLGPEIDDPLAGQARHSGTADVLDDEVRTRRVDDLDDPRRHRFQSRIPALNRGHPPLVRTDRGWRAGHPGSVEFADHAPRHRPTPRRGGRRLTRQSDRRRRPGRRRPRNRRRSSRRRSRPPRAHGLRRRPRRFRAGHGRGVPARCPSGAEGRPPQPVVRRCLGRASTGRALRPRRRGHGAVPLGLAPPGHSRDRSRGCRGHRRAARAGRCRPSPRLGHGPGRRGDRSSAARLWRRR